MVFLFGLMRSIGVGPPKVVRRSGQKTAIGFLSREVGGPSRYFKIHPLPYPSIYAMLGDTMKKERLTYALIFGAVFFIEVLIALFVRDNFIRPYVGDMLVTVLIAAFLRVIIPRGLRLLPLYVFIFSAMVEIAQYFDIVKLLGLESSRILSILIGRTFSFADILCYAVGCLAFFGIDYLLQKKKA